MLTPTRCYPKVPEIPLSHINHLLKTLFAAIPFEVVLFCIDTVIPAGFPLSEAPMEVIS
jgi:hypothetical protein